jgi:hypothetical protein
MPIGDMGLALVLSEAPEKPAEDTAEPSDENTPVQNRRGLVFFSRRLLAKAGARADFMPVRFATPC